VSAPDPTGTSQSALLMVVDPAARQWDGESVRIARDVLSAGAPGVKVCLPESQEETERALARRGSRRPVVVGDDRTLLWTVQLLHRERELADAALSVIPVGATDRVALTRGLGVPSDAVSAARTVLDGVEHRLGLLIDDSGGVVLGGLRIPGTPQNKARSEPAAGSSSPARGVLTGLTRTRRSLSRSVRAVRAVRGVRAAWGEIPQPAQRLRVEADGELLADLDQPVTEVSMTSPRTLPWGEVTVRPQSAPESGLVRMRASAVTVSGPDFSYCADALVGGPVRSRTWTALAGAWSLTLPA
jgi:hypothetical protein